MSVPTRLERHSVGIRAFGPADIEELTELRTRNRDFLAPWEPLRTPTFHTYAGQRAEIERDLHEWAADRTYAFAIFALDSERIVGRVALANVVRGAWENATLGYFVDQSSGRRGVATEAVGLILDFAFGPCRLHRVQAAVMPHNAASKRVLEKNGFRHEGFSPHYLRLAGSWRDHDLYALTLEDLES